MAIEIENIVQTNLERTISADFAFLTEWASRTMQPNIIYARKRFEFLYSYVTSPNGLEDAVAGLQRPNGDFSRIGLLREIRKITDDAELIGILKEVICGARTPEKQIKYYSATPEDIRLYNRKTLLGMVASEGIKPDLLLRGLASLHAYDVLSSVTAGLPDGDLKAILDRHLTKYMSEILPRKDNTIALPILLDGKHAEESLEGFGV